jgi:hypothetical protein
VVGRSMAVAIQSITKLLVNTKYGKRISEVTSKNFPLGYGLIAKKKG